MHVLALHAVEQDGEATITAAVPVLGRQRADGQPRRQDGPAALGGGGGAGEHLPVEHGVDELGVAMLLEGLLVEETGGDLDDGLFGKGWERVGGLVGWYCDRMGGM